MKYNLKSAQKFRVHILQAQKLLIRWQTHQNQEAHDESCEMYFKFKKSLKAENKFGSF